MDPISLRDQWQGHLQTHLDRETRSEPIKHVLIRGHRQLPDTLSKEQDLHLPLSPVLPQTLETSEKESEVYLASTAHPGLHTLQLPSLSRQVSSKEEIFHSSFYSKVSQKHGTCLRPLKQQTAETDFTFTPKLTRLKRPPGIPAPFSAGDRMKARSPRSWRDTTSRHHLSG